MFRRGSIQCQFCAVYAEVRGTLVSGGNLRDGDKFRVELRRQYDLNLAPRPNVSPIGRLQMLLRIELIPALESNSTQWQRPLRPTILYAFGIFKRPRKIQPLLATWLKISTNPFASRQIAANSISWSYLILARRAQFSDSLVTSRAARPLAAHGCNKLNRILMSQIDLRIRQKIL